MSKSMLLTIDLLRQKVAGVLRFAAEHLVKSSPEAETGSVH